MLTNEKTVLKTLGSKRKHFNCFGLFIIKGEIFIYFFN